MQKKPQQEVDEALATDPETVNEALQYGAKFGQPAFEMCIAGEEDKMGIYAETVTWMRENLSCFTAPERELLAVDLTNGMLDVLEALVQGRMAAAEQPVSPCSQV